MKLFYSPKLLFSILKKEEPPESYIAKEITWYFSEEGCAAYKTARTARNRARFFFAYLAQVISDEEIAYKCAVLLANAVVGVKCSFARYPDILDMNRNPLLIPISELAANGYRSYEESVEPILRALHRSFGMEDGNKVELTQPGKHRETTDLYVMERYVLWLFCPKTDGLIPLYQL